MSPQGDTPTHIDTLFVVCTPSEECGTVFRFAIAREGSVTKMDVVKSIAAAVKHFIELSTVAGPVMGLLIAAVGRRTAKRAYNKIEEK